MPRVTFLPMKITVEVNEKDYPYGDHGLPGSLLDIALKHGISLEHACGGNCACTTCHVIIKEGMEHLTEMGDTEADLLDKATGVTLQSRLGCQCVVKGDVVVEIPAQNVNLVSESDLLEKESK